MVAIFLFQRDSLRRPPCNRYMLRLGGLSEKDEKEMNLFGFRGIIKLSESAGRPGGSSASNGFL